MLSLRRENTLWGGTEEVPSSAPDKTSTRGQVQNTSNYALEGFITALEKRRREKKTKGNDHVKLKEPEYRLTSDGLSCGVPRKELQREKRFREGRLGSPEKKI